MLTKSSDLFLQNYVTPANREHFKPRLIDRIQPSITHHFRSEILTLPVGSRICLDGVFSSVQNARFLGKFT